MDRLMYMGAVRLCEGRGVRDKENNRGIITYRNAQSWTGHVPKPSDTSGKGKTVCGMS